MLNRLQNFKAMKTIYSFVFLLIFVFTSCYYRVPLQTGPANNNETYEVEYLFEHDGCKVYRFYDRGNYVYFSNCKGEVTSIANDSTATRIQNRTDVFFDEFKEEE